MSSGIVIHGIGCILILLLVLSAQAIDYEVHRHDVISAKLTTDDIVLTSRDFLEKLHFVKPKASHTLQERTEHLLHFGALLRMRVLEIFGGLLYIYYDNFSVTEVESLHKVYREIFERRYNVFSLIPDILKKQTTKPSAICNEIYAHAKLCPRDSASVCGRIKRHNFLDLGDLETPSRLNVTYLARRLSKLSKQYPRGFSLEAVRKFLQRGMLTITPGLLSGLLYHVKYEILDDDIRLAERELVRHFHEITRTTESSSGTILKQLTTKELKQFHSVNSFFRYYINMYLENIVDDDLRRHAFLIAKRIADIGTIDDNIQLLGNVYEDRAIHIRYLFDLVLPDDTLDKDVIDAKRYLVKTLENLNVVKRYLRVYKYQQFTPAQLTLEITGQLRDIDFARDIAVSLHVHAKYWRAGHMIETLHELLELFDAYENLRHVPEHRDTMRKLDQIKKSLSTMTDVPVEILCNAPRACLRIGLRSVLRCKLVSSEIKVLIKDFLDLSDVCVNFDLRVASDIRRTVDIPLTFSKVTLTTKFMEMNTTVPITTTPLSTSETNTEEVTTVSEIVEGPRTTTEFVDTSTTTPTTTTVEFTIPTKATTTTMKTETSTITTESPTTTVTESPATTITESLTTTTTTAKAPTTIATESPTTIITESPATTTESPTTITESPTTTTETPTTTTETPTTTTETPTTTTETPTTTTESPTTTTESPTTTTESPTTTTESPTTTTESPTTTTESLTTTTTESPTTTITETPTTTVTESPTTTVTESPTIITTESRATTTTESSTTITESPVTTTESPTPTVELSTITVTESPATSTTKSSKTISTVSPTTLITTLLTTYTTSPTTTSTTILPTTTEEIPTIDLKLSRSRFKVTSGNIIEEISTTASTSSLSRECESDECEASTEETSEIVTDAPKPKISIPFKILKQYSKVKKISPETTTATTKLHETSTTKGHECATRSCSEECSSESSTTRSCEGSCGSEEDCDSEDEGSVDDVSEKMENHTIECDKQCERESTEISSSECDEKDKSCECASSSKDERSSAECVTLCRSSCEDDPDNCSTSVMPMIDIKVERKRQRALCEIRDFHHRRQKNRLAKMRAISAAATAAAVVASSHAGVLRSSRTSRRRPRIVTKKLYNLLAAELPPVTKDKEESKKVTEYLLNRSVAGQIKGGDGRKRRKQLEEIHIRKRKMSRKLKNKRLSGDAYGQLERIPERVM